MKVRELAKLIYEKELVPYFEKRQAIYSSLDSIVERGLPIPPERKADWEVWCGQEKRIPWNLQRYTVYKLKKTAKRMAKVRIKNERSVR